MSDQETVAEEKPMTLGDIIDHLYADELKQLVEQVQYMNRNDHV